MHRLGWGLAAVEALVIVFLLLQPSATPEPGSAPPEVSPAEEARPSAEAPAATPGGEAGDAPAPAEPGEGVYLFGRVLGRDGKVPSRGWVSFPNLPAKERSVGIDAAGWYGKGGLAAGEHEVRAQATGFETAVAAVEVPAGARVLRRDFTLRSQLEIAIRFVTPEGKPFFESLSALGKEKRGTVFFPYRGLSAVATREPPPARLPPTLLASHRRYGPGEYRSSMDMWNQPEDGRNGTLYVTGGLPVYLSACLRSEVLSTVVLSEPKDRVDLVVDPDRVAAMSSGVRFRLVCEGLPEPPEKIRVDLSDRQSGGMGSADRDGDVFTVKGKPPGALVLTVRADAEHESRLQVVDLPPGEILDLGTIRLGAVRELTVRVVDPDGEPAPRASVTIYDAGRSFSEQRGSPYLYETDAEGKTTILMLGPHRYVVVATREDEIGVAEVDLSAGGEGELLVRLADAVATRVDDAALELPAALRIEDAAGHVLRSLDLTTHWPYTVHLVPGSYTALVTGPDGVERRIAFTVAAGKPGTLELR